MVRTAPVNKVNCGRNRTDSVRTFSGPDTQLRTARVRTVRSGLSGPDTFRERSGTRNGTGLIHRAASRGPGHQTRDTRTCPALNDDGKLSYNRSGVGRDTLCIFRCGVKQVRTPPVRTLLIEGHRDRTNRDGTESDRLGQVGTGLIPEPRVCEPGEMPRRSCANRRSKLGRD